MKKSYTRGNTPSTSWQMKNFYGRYVDDTLVFAKPEHSPLTLFCVDLTAFTVTSVLRSTSLKMKMFISWKSPLQELLWIFTGKTQTIPSISLSPVMNLGLIRSLGLELCSNHASCICDNDSLFQKQISVIKTFLSWNGLLDLLRLTSLNVSYVVAPSQDHSTMILARQLGFDCLMQACDIGESIVNRLVQKLKRCFKEPACF